MLESPGSIIFQLGPLTVRWYGVMIAIGFLCATYFAARLARRWHLSADQIVNLILIVFIGGIVGARLYFVALTWSDFQLHPEEIFQTWRGGMSIHGGFIGGVIAGWVYCRLQKLPFLTCCDLGAACVGLGQAIGRWGNFFKSEAFGRPVSPDYFLKLYIPPERRPPQYAMNNYFHPTFLYESVWDLAVFCILYFFLADRLRQYPGLTFFCYIALYSIGRLLIEPLRLDSLPAFGMPAPILASAIMLFLACLAIVLLALRYKSKMQRG
jgi:phosphatidylglycerol:prolipoprotein diacylglycerol transferase